MDSLTMLVKSIGLRGCIDQFCRFAAPWSVEHSARAEGQIPYHMVLVGQGVVEVGHSRLQLGAGDLVILRRGTVHTLRSAPDGTLVSFSDNHSPQGPVEPVERVQDENDFDVLSGTFEIGHHGPLLLQVLPEIVHLSTRGRDDGLWLDALMRMMRYESLQAQPGASAVIEELSRALFNIVIRTLVARGTMKHRLLGLLTEPRLSLAMTAVIDAPAKPWTIAGLGEQWNMSRASFARHFADISEMTPLEVVTALRMDVAGRMVRESQRPTQMIGEA
jgi:AraC family transcriptional regulator, activator of mtrCDE